MRLPRTFRRRPRRHDTQRLLAAAGFAGDDLRLAAIAAHTDHVRLPAGRTLVHGDRTARELVAVVSGEAAVLHDDGSCSTVAAGTQIGGPEVVGGRRHTATVVAATEVEVVVVNGPAVRWAHQEGILGPFGAPAAGVVAPPASRRATAPGLQLAR
jgi:CRP-like cAMP-binding protein